MSLQEDNRLGYFGFMETVVELVERNGKLLLCWPGIPNGYEIRLLPTAEPGSYKVRGGPAHGAIAQLPADDKGQIEAIEVSGFRLARCAAPIADQNLAGVRHLAPAIAPNPERSIAFAALWQQLKSKADGAEISYILPYPKYQFLHCLEEQEAVIFHGSGDDDIDKFVPRRNSIELNDETGRGNKLAIYGTHDAIWPLFFAIIDRPNLRGSIRNGVDYFYNEAGDQLAAYHFSINREQLPERPYRTGMLYILPRETFERLQHAPGILANEWASEAAVRPIARLRIAPEDFPFLEQIAGHDDSVLLEGARLQRQVMTAVAAAWQEEERLILELTWDEALANVILPFIKSQRSMMPAASYELSFPAGKDPVTLAITGPAAYQAVIRQRLGDRLRA